MRELLTVLSSTGDYVCPHILSWASEPEIANTREMLASLAVRERSTVTYDKFVTPFVSFVIGVELTPTLGRQLQQATVQSRPTHLRV